LELGAIPRQPKGAPPGNLKRGVYTERKRVIQERGEVNLVKLKISNGLGEQGVEG